MYNKTPEYNGHRGPLPPGGPVVSHTKSPCKYCHLQPITSLQSPGAARTNLQLLLHVLWQQWPNRKRQRKVSFTSFQKLRTMFLPDKVKKSTTLTFSSKPLLGGIKSSNFISASNVNLAQFSFEPHKIGVVHYA